MILLNASAVLLLAVSVTALADDKPDQNPKPSPSPGQIDPFPEGQIPTIEKRHCFYGSGRDGGARTIIEDLQHDKTQTFGIDCQVEVFVESVVQKGVKVCDLPNQTDCLQRVWNNRGGDIYLRKTCKAIPSPKGQYDPMLPWITYGSAGEVMNDSISGWGRVNIGDAKTFAGLSTPSGRVFYLDGLWNGGGLNHLDATLYIRRNPDMPYKYTALVNELIYPKLCTKYSKQGGEEEVCTPEVFGRTDLFPLEEVDCSRLREKDLFPEGVQRGLRLVK